MIFRLGEMIQIVYIMSLEDAKSLVLAHHSERGTIGVVKVITSERQKKISC